MKKNIFLFLIFILESIKWVASLDVFVSNIALEEKGTMLEPYHNIYSAINKTNCSESTIFFLLDPINTLNGTFLMNASCIVLVK